MDAFKTLGSFEGHDEGRLQLLDTVMHDGAWLLVATWLIDVFPRKPTLRMAMSYSDELQEAVLDAWTEAERAWQVWQSSGSDRIKPPTPANAMLKDALPWIALLISLVALFVSVLNYRRDRANLQATSMYSDGSEGSDAAIRIDIVNAGRRPIILDTLVYAEAPPNWFGLRRPANWIGIYFDRKNGLTLDERQTYRQWYKMEDLYQHTDDEMLEPDDMWITDTLGHRHKIKGIRQNIAKLKAWDKL